MTEVSMDLEETKLRNRSRCWTFKSELSCAHGAESFTQKRCSKPDFPGNGHRGASVGLRELPAPAGGPGSCSHSGPGRAPHSAARVRNTHDTGLGFAWPLGQPRTLPP